MEFVVGTHAHLLSVNVSDNWELQNVEVLNVGHHYGVALLDRENPICFTARGPGGTTLSDYEQRVPSDEGSSYNKIESRSLSGGASRLEWGSVHQIAFCNEGLYLANTQSNSLVYLSEQGDESVYYFGDSNSDRNHINSVFPNGDGQVVALLHNKGRKNSEIAILEHCENKFRLINRVPIWDKSCHNIFIEDNLLVYNASKYGDFVVASLETGETIQRLHFPGHTKGLSITKDYFIIGNSEHAVREAREFSSGTMEVIDRNSLQWITTVELDHRQLTDPVGNVNEIRCLSEPEYGHAASQSFDVEWKQLELFTNEWSQRLGLRLRQLRSLKHWPRPVIDYITGMKSRN